EILGSVPEAVVDWPEHVREQIQGRGRNQRIVSITRAVRERNPAAGQIHLGQLFSGVNFRGELGGHLAVDLAGSAVQRKFELGVWTSAPAVWSRPWSYKET